MSIGERIKKVRQSKDLTQQEFCEQIGLKRNSISLVESGKRNISDQAIKSICREFNVSETWLRTGEGEMFVPKEEDALDELVKQYGLSDGDHVLIEKFLRLKPVERQAVITYMQDVVATLNAGTALPGYAPSPATISKTGPATSVPDTAEQEWTGADLAAKVAELERQNQDLAAKIAGMEEEDALFGLTDVSSTSPSVSVGNFSPAQKVKK